MNLSSALSPTPTRNNRDRRALSAVTAPKFETAVTTKLAVMVVWGHINADFCCVSSHETQSGLHEAQEWSILPEEHKEKLPF